MTTFPDTIEAFASKDGRYSFDADRLFPCGKSARYMLANCRAAAIILRCPEGFELLEEGFLASTEDTLAGKLDDALKHVARALK